MTEKFCRRCGLSILGGEDFVRCYKSRDIEGCPSLYEHFTAADCIERLRADNERLRKRVAELEASGES